MPTPDLLLPALRAVIAGVREKIPGLELASRDERHSTGMLYREAASDLTTLASACERLAEENERLREQLTAAEAAREAVLASLAAAEAVAGEVREACAKVVEKVYGPWSVDISREDLVRKWARETSASIRALDLPTPSAALQRVREQALRGGAERALRWAADHPCGTGGLADLLGAVADDPRDQWAGYVKRGIAALFPTPDAGGK